MMSSYLNGSYDGFWNLTDYTPVEMALFAGGCWLWVLAYAILIRNLRKYKFVEMPTIAGAGNFAWEFAFSWIGPFTNMGFLCLTAYRAWFFLDIYIWYNLAKYSPYDTTVQLFRRHKWAYALIITILWLVAFQTFRWSDLEWIIGARTAYFLNGVIALQYFVNYLRLGPKYPFSINIAWMKGLGTGANTVFMWLHYPDDHFLHFCGVFIAIVDIVYFSILFRDRVLRKIKPLEGIPPIPEIPPTLEATPA